MEKTKKQAMKFPSTLSSPAKSHGRGLGKAKGGKGGIAQRIPWSEDEEDALRRAENRHGREWAEMLRDPEFAAIFQGRTNINLKDKWRNLLKEDAQAKNDDE
ncbi:hypothetical protein B484DRAFT_483210 [Ochromonadaceae sp. CCMP2298]|nr:hypothetical protein B484DRAFT_483210 [Ochromonadaceae sp. CCMP2298]